MNAQEFKEKVDKSFNLQLIVTGLAGLVKDEGYTPYEAFELLRETKHNTFYALAEMKREVSN